jgi:hypothetical protein
MTKQNIYTLYSINQHSRTSHLGEKMANISLYCYIVYMVMCISQRLTRLKKHKIETGKFHGENSTCSALIRYILK